MLNAQLEFDKNRRRVIQCPCGERTNRDGKFIPYIGYDNKGYCHSCQMTYLPSIEFEKGEKPFIPQNRTLPNLELSPMAVEKSIDLLTDNFSKYLIDLFGKDLGYAIKKKFSIGSSKMYPDVTLFWLIDEEKKVRTAKMMKFDTEGRRIKNYNNFIHSKLIKDGFIPENKFSIKLPLFGQGQVLTERVAVVESEKTAAIMAILSPDFTWLATCGASGLTYEKLKVIKSKMIYLFPDLGQYDRWTQKAEYFQQVLPNSQFQVSDILEKHAPSSHHKYGYDILDYCLKVDKDYRLALTDEMYPVLWDS